MTDATKQLIVGARAIFAKHGIDFSLPWEGDLDDLERERFDALASVVAFLAPALPAPDKAQEEVAAAHEVQRIREAVMNGDTDWQTECTAAIEHNHALRRELSAAHASGREEGERAALAKELPAFRRALEGAAILLNINEGDKQPYASGYDSVHDAYNEVWHAWKMAERLCAALPVPSPAQERGHVGLWPWDHPQ